jgi:acetyl-CoA synthetase
MPADFATGPIVWRPTPDYIENARLTEFMRAHHIASFDELMQRSTSDVAWFTDAVLKFLDIQFYTPYSNVVDLSRGIAWPQWCVGGEMNIIHNCLDKYQSSPHKDRPALVWEGEDGQSRTLSYADLHAKVNQAANALRSLGIGKGDAVGIFMPMVPEIAVALLAIAKVGGIILPLFSGYGVEAVVSRLADGNAKALFTADGFPRRGKPVEMKSIADAAATQLPGLRHIIVLDHAKLSVPFVRGRDH